MASSKYTALLRGINVGGKSIVAMSDLNKLFAGLKFNNIQTFLNSGNVIFETAENILVTNQIIEEALRKKFHREIKVILLPQEQIITLVKINPFANTTITSNTRLYVSFTKNITKVNSVLPIEVDNFKILQVIDKAIFSVVEITPGKSTPEFMLVLEREFGKDITTRSWNTVQKIAKL